MATVNLTVAEYLANPVIDPADDVTIVDAGANIATLTDVQIAGLTAANVDAIDANDGALTLNALQAAALGTVDLNADDVVTVTDTGAGLAALTTPQITALAANNVDAFDANDNALTLDVSQALALGSIVLADGDAVAVADTDANLAALTPPQIAALAASNVDSVGSTDGTLAVDVTQLQAYVDNGIAFTATDTVTLAEFSVVLNGGNAAVIAALAGQGVDVIDSLDDQLTYSIEMVQALGTVQLTAGDLVTVQDTAANFAALSPIQIAALAAKNVDVLDVTDAPITLTVDQLAALGGINFVAGANVSLVDTGSKIATLSAAQIAGLAAQGIDVVDANDDVLPLSVGQYKALGSVQIAAGDDVRLYGSVAEINGLTDPEIAALATAGIAFPDLRDGGAALTALTAADFAALGAKGVDSLDATDNALSLTVAELRALGPIQLTAADNVKLTDAGGSIGALSAAEIANLAGQRIDSIDASDNVLNLTFAQFSALGAVTLTADDYVTLTENGATLSSLSAAQLAALKGQGIDAVNAAGPLNLSTAQYAALGIPLVGGGALTIAGTSGVDKIYGAAGGESLKGLNGNDVLSGGLGDDKLFGGSGKDSLTGGGGRDAFVFDTKLSKKTNLDKIADFNVKDDSVYLDNAIFKKLGKGTEAYPKKLVKSYFTVGSEAKDKNDYVIYDKKKGILYYDQDGSGSKDQVEIATLKKSLKMTYNDFFVI